MVLGIIHYELHPLAKPIAAPAMPFDPLIIGFAFGGCFALLLLVGLPLVLLRFYARSSVQTTLDLMDPHPYWTDRCPLPVLGWAIACVVGGIGFASSAIYQVFPFFTSMLTGSPADAAILCLSLMLIVGGVLSYRQNPLGGLMTMAAFIVLAASFSTFAVLGDHHKYLDQIFRTMPAAQRQTAEQFAGNGLMGFVSAALMYGAAVVFGLVFRSRFGQKVNAPAFPS
jgi:hypothetical protein